MKIARMAVLVMLTLSSAISGAESLTSRIKISAIQEVVIQKDEDGKDVTVIKLADKIGNSVADFYIGADGRLNKVVGVDGGQPLSAVRIDGDSEPSTLVIKNDMVEWTRIYESKFKLPPIRVAEVKKKTEASPLKLIEGAYELFAVNRKGGKEVAIYTLRNKKNREVTEIKKEVFFFDPPMDDKQFQLIQKDGKYFPAIPAKDVDPKSLVIDLGLVK